jgi:hypothetical protein
MLVLTMAPFIAGSGAIVRLQPKLRREQEDEDIKAESATAV